MSDAEALVVGGGLAGAAVALRLARAGRRVVLLEREAGPTDKVCGEFLSSEALCDLRALGLDPEGLGAAAIETVALARRDRFVAAPLPFPALSLSRRVLDEALLAAAADAGVEVRRGQRVSALTQEAGGWTARTDDGDAVQAAHAFLASGKHDVRGWKRPAGVQSDLVGFKMHWRLAQAQAAALAGRVELYLFPGGYAGLEPIEDGRANLCLLVRRGRLGQVDAAWPRLLAAIRAANPALDLRLVGGEAARDKPLAAAALPYGYVARGADGLWRLGDQAAVIPSFSGDGMSIALHSARRAADAFLAGDGADAFQARLHGELAAQVRRAVLLSQGLVRPWSQSALASAAGVHPGLMRLAAVKTRIPGWRADETTRRQSHDGAAPR